MTRLLVLALSVIGVSAHVSMVPNYGGESGGYMYSAIKVPHGEKGMHTTRMVVHVPRGVLSARPEVPSGWNVTVINYDLAEEDRYLSHGNPVTTAPDQIIFQAETPAAALYTDHLMLIGLQLKIGCSFRDQVTSDYSGSNSIWQGQYTLWFKVEQHSSYDNSLLVEKSSLWTGALLDGEDGSSSSWNPPHGAGVKACPYIFIYPGGRCSIDHSGESVVGGLTWMGNYIDPVENQKEVKHEQHVIELATEAALTAQENLDELYAEEHELAAMELTVAALTARIDSLEDDKDNLLLLAVVAVALSAALAGVFVGLCCFRVTAKSSFARVISAVPLVSEYQAKGGVTMTSVTADRA